jgi:hypothetical protein
MRLDGPVFDYQPEELHMPPLMDSDGNGKTGVTRCENRREPGQGAILYGDWRRRAHRKEEVAVLYIMSRKEEGEAESNSRTV